jgi:hypothetical protein
MAREKEEDDRVWERLAYKRCSVVDDGMEWTRNKR